MGAYIMYVKFLIVMAVFIIGSLFVDSLSLGHYNPIIKPITIGLNFESE